MFSINVPASHLKAASFFMAENDIRYYLNGLHVEVKGTEIIMVATDGHKLGAVHSVDPDSSLGRVEFTIPRELLEKMPAHSKTVAIRVDSPEPSEGNIQQGTVTLTFDTGDIRARALLDGTFPDWRRVMPAPKEKFTAGEWGQGAPFNPNLLVAFVKAAQALGCTKHVAGTSVELAYCGYNATRVDISEHPEFIGVVMPFRSKPTFDPCTWMDSTR